MKIYLIKHMLQVRFWINPWCDSITKKNEILNDSTRIYTDHAANATECRILFFIISNVPERCTPTKCRTLDSRKIHKLKNIWTFRTIVICKVKIIYRLNCVSKINVPIRHMSPLKFYHFWLLHNTYILSWTEIV